MSSCANSQPKKVDEAIARERQQLKNFAVCECLAHSLPEGDSIIARDGSAAGYFEIGNYSLDTYTLIDSLSKVISKKEYLSKEGRS